MARNFNKNVKAKTFKVGDWVLRKVFQNTKEIKAGKLAPAWEGSYRIQKVVGNGAYRLITKDGKYVPKKLERRPSQTLSLLRVTSMTI